MDLSKFNDLTHLPPDEFDALLGEVLSEDLKARLPESKPKKKSSPKKETAKKSS